MKLTFTKKELLNIPNILCYIRLLCVPAFALAFFLAQGNPHIDQYAYMYISLAIFTFASLTDVFDGKIARKFHMESAVGAALDPLADKLLQLMAVICLTVNGNIFWLFPVLIGIRELYQIICASMLVNKNIVGKANYWGKSAALAVAIGIIVSTLGATYNPMLKCVTADGVLASWFGANNVEIGHSVGVSLFWTAFAILCVGTVLGYIAAGSYTHVILSQLGGVKKIKNAENIRMDYFHNSSEATASREEMQAAQTDVAPNESAQTPEGTEVEDAISTQNDTQNQDIQDTDDDNN